ncbi:Fic family protein [Sorangium sp. So ce861]|uniref:Fic family protein n=1 Tax=Sorangium sp. So ce861 TaxID=3133323 RepID=UPI003F5FB6D8
MAQSKATFAGEDLYPTVVAKAATLCFSLVQGHPFVDGNKRVGHAAMEVSQPMYISLDRIDVELESKDGRARVIQTDHRTAAEISARPALSTIVALIRCLNPRRAYGELELFYNCQHGPPAFLRDAVAACGARLWVGDDPAVLDQDLPQAAIDEGAVDRLVNGAMQELARELVEGSDANEPLGALELLEQGMARSGFPDEEEDVTAFWTSVLELGALAGAAVGASNSGAWFHDVAGQGTLPLKYRCAFRGEMAAANPLGKALKFIREQGGGEEPSFLVRTLRSSS